MEEVAAAGRRMGRPNQPLLQRYFDSGSVLCIVFLAACTGQSFIQDNKNKLEFWQLTDQQKRRAACLALLVMRSAGRVLRSVDFTTYR